MIEFQMPSLGADMEAGTLIEWRKKPGDAVKRGDIIAEVETQKGLIEIEVFDEGIIGELLIKEGTKVPVGTVMALINPTETTLETRKETISEKPTVKIQPTEEKIVEKATAEKFEERHIKVSPLAKRIATENNIDLSQIQGTGEDGSITKDDVEKAISQKAKIEKKEEKSLPKNLAIRSAIAAAMSKSNTDIPHYYLEKRIDITKALAWLREANSKRPIQKRLLPAALLIKAVAKSLIDFPELNAIWDNEVQIKKEINIGFVVSLRGGGVIIPAIHKASEKSIDEIMEALNDMIPRARAMKLRSSDLSDSTITITSLGEGGADVVFGVIYPPQVAIIGFGGSSQQPFAENGMLGIRTVFTVTLAGDHRATDGLIGSDFLVTLNKQLQNPEAL
ncbi:dihydrolipoamide acetyltransferase family protein [Flavobacterium soyangense]|uniref:Dihydrolipoamide acetyltransferase component of pyruvate dehydrogenase complex n=1 Tax=Flavobacterium soyangense TaxID=2023265 RepID=A0A930UC13_9FLAO|nr:dihydrolipoamide acetyltransferase family protein [Flavobacterium soyangense]MBF2708536.1 2-oxo acid dehydrogenase subunit E2 [Flavobacterium soyangense]